VSPMPPGSKDDSGKAPWHLLPWDSVRQVVRVLAYGAEKYCAGGWKLVPDARERYFSAAERHLIAWQEGEDNDPESGLSHLAHSACSLLFLLWFEARR
jgi:hypothetical protein